MSPRNLGLFVASIGLSSGAFGCNENEQSAGRPIEGPSGRDDGSLPVLHAVPEFSFRDQGGKSFGSNQLSGRPYLAAFMFTRCPSICPRLTKRMKEIDAAVKKADKNLQLVSFSVDPEHDTPEVLAAYAKKHGANLDNWAFLTGDYKTIAKTSEEGFKIGFSGTIDEGKPHLGITHGSHLILVDGDGKIRGYFRSSDDETVTEVVRALDRL